MQTIFCLQPLQQFYRYNACLVGVTRYKLNNELARFIEKHPNLSELHSSERQHSLYPCYTPRAKVRNRLSVQDIAHLVAEFKAGAPKHVLAKRYCIGLGSVKKLLREEGVKRRSWKDVQE